MNENSKSVAPSPLPEVLPDGVHSVGARTNLAGWRLKNGKCGQRYVPTADDGRYADVYTNVRWDEYYLVVALTSHPAKVEEFKAGDRVSAKAWHTERRYIGILSTRRRDAMNDEGVSESTHAIMDVERAEDGGPTGLAGPRVCILRDSLRHEPAQPGAGVKGADLFIRAGCGYAVKKIDAYTRPNLCNGARTCKDCHFGPRKDAPSKPAEQVEVATCIACNRPAQPNDDRCSYCAHRLSNHMRGCESVVPNAETGAISNLPERIAAARKQQHLDALDRPMRRGPLRDRCRYGAKLSARGWETDETDP